MPYRRPDGRCLRRRGAEFQIAYSVGVGHQPADAFDNVRAPRGYAFLDLCDIFVYDRLCVGRVHTVFGNEQLLEHAVVLFQKRHEHDRLAVLFSDERSEVRNNQSLVGSQVFCYDFVDHVSEVLKLFSKICFFHYSSKRLCKFGTQNPCGKSAKRADRIISGEFSGGLLFLVGKELSFFTSIK